MNKNYITKHFTIAECEKSAIAIRHGIKNILPADYYGNAFKVSIMILEPCRAHFNTPITPSSWYRSPELNKLIGSGSTSQHLTASAVDFEIAGRDNLEVAKYIRDNLVYDQLILEYYNDDDPFSGWVHCSFSDNNRKEVKRYNGKQYLTGLTG